MNNIIETLKGPGRLYAHMYEDESPESPRDWDCLGRIATVRLRRHRLHDTDEAYLPEDLGSWDKVETYLRVERDAAVILPVFLYEHSGTAISTGSFIGRAQHAAWDSGQVGFIYATRARILAEYKAKKMTKEVLALAKKCLETEIETFNQYIQGDVYFYQVIKETKCDKCGHIEPECVDSCGGLFGYKYAKEQAIAAMEAAAKED